MTQQRLTRKPRKSPRALRRFERFMNIFTRGENARHGREENRTVPAPDHLNTNTGQGLPNVINDENHFPPLPTSPTPPDQSERPQIERFTAPQARHPGPASPTVIQRQTSEERLAKQQDLENRRRREAKEKRIQERLTKQARERARQQRERAEAGLAEAQLEVQRARRREEELQAEFKDSNVHLRNDESNVESIAADADVDGQGDAEHDNAEVEVSPPSDSEASSETGQAQPDQQNEQEQQAIVEPRPGQIAVTAHHGGRVRVVIIDPPNQRLRRLFQAKLAERDTQKSPPPVEDGWAKEIWRKLTGG